MSIYFLNYGHYDNYNDASKVKKKILPNASVFHLENEYTIRVTYFIDKEHAEKMVKVLPEGYWIQDPVENV